MSSYFDDAVVDEDEDICGWGTVDFDDDFLDRGRRKAASKAVLKPKQRPQKTFSNSNPGSEKPIQQKQSRHRPSEAATLVEKRIRIANQVESSTENQSPENKPKQKPTHEIEKLSAPKPPPKTSSILEENAAIAALGRQRRMKVVAAAMATNVSRRPGIASVVSASFDYDSADDHEEPDTPPRHQTDRVIPYPKPERQQNKLPHAVAPPAAPIEVVKKIQSPVSLPLLSINPNCEGSDTRLSGREKKTLKPSQNNRRHRQPKSSLLPSQDVSENWESNFRPSLRRFRSPREYQTTGPTEESTKPTLSSFKGDFQQVQDLTGRRKDIQLPSIHHTTKDSCTATATSVDISRSNSEASDQSMRDEEEGESWYEDPEVAAISMAGLIQALSMFGKQKKPHKSGKRKKRRAKQQTLVLNQQTPLNLPLPPFDKMNVTSTIEEQQNAEPRCRRRKHRKKLSE